MNTISRKTIINLRKRYLSPTLQMFQAFDEPFIISKGKMEYIWDENGKKYLDLLAQNVCISVGHAHPRVKNAAIIQMDKLPHCSSVYHNEQSVQLGKEIIEKLPEHPSGDEWIVHFVNDGSEAVDLAVQMARVYTGRQEMFALCKGYHGLQGYAAGLTAIGKTTQPAYSSMFTSINHITPNNIEQLEDLLKFKMGGSVAGIIIEPLQGYGGIYPLNNGYMKDAFKLIKDNGGVTISDEVQTGYGRCGESFWGFQMSNNNVIPDMITIAKGMGNGIGIIGAVICRRSIAEAFTSKMFFNTYSHNPVACAAAREVIRVIDEENIIQNCNKQGTLFRQKLQVLCEKMPSVYTEIRGSGLFQALEIYGKTHEESCKNTHELHRRIRDNGVVLGRGSAAGNVFRIQPPMCIKEEQVYEVIDIIEDVGHKWKRENNL
jgi:alanine-glyoxylate transaminase/(R)-3-amino-2-methylpropionate-pyruvate transaminase